MAVQPCPLPEHALLARYNAKPGAYTDAFVTEVPQQVALYDFVEAFYTTPLFRTEKAILRVTVGGRVCNWDETRLRDGGSDYAAWTVEDRSEDQLLMCDFAAATRSWFHVAKVGGGTALYFGSAVVPKEGSTEMPFLAKALLGFHTAYSRALLASAARRLKRGS